MGGSSNYGFSYPKLFAIRLSFKLSWVDMLIWGLGLQAKSSGFYVGVNNGLLSRFQFTKRVGSGENCPQLYLF